MIKMLLDNTLIDPDGKNINSDHTHKTRHSVVQELATVFPYSPYDGGLVGDAVREIEWNSPILRYSTCTFVAGAALVVREGRDPAPTHTAADEKSVSLNPFKDDYSTAPQKVKDFIAIVATREEKAKYTSSLKQRRVRVPVMENYPHTIEAVTRDHPRQVIKHGEIYTPILDEDENPTNQFEKIADARDEIIEAHTEIIEPERTVTRQRQKMETVTEMIPEKVEIIKGVATQIPAHEGPVKKPVTRWIDVVDQNGDLVMEEPQEA